MADDINIRIRAEEAVKTAINATIRAFRRLGPVANGVVKRLATATRIAIAGFKRLGSVARRVMRGIRRTSSTLGRGFRRLGVAIAGALVASVRHAVNFRTAMAQVNTMISRGGIEELTNQVRDLSAELGLAKDALADGLYQTLSASVPKGNAIDFLRTSSKAAIAGATDVNTAVDALSTIINAYSLDVQDAEKVSDIFFTTVKRGKVTFGELASGIGQVAGIAAQAGIAFKEVAATIATVTKQGIRSDIAITGLRQAILAVIAPSDDLKTKLAAIGTTGEELLKKRGIAGAFQQIAKFADGSTEALQKLIPNIRALPVVLAVTGKNARVANRDLQAMSRSGNATAEAFQKMEIAKQWPRLWQSILGIAQRVGETFDRRIAPAIKSLTTRIREFAKQLDSDKSLDRWVDKAIKAMGVVKGLFDDILTGGEQRASAFEFLGDALRLSLEIGAESAIELLLRAAPFIGKAIKEGTEFAVERSAVKGVATSELLNRGQLGFRIRGEEPITAAERRNRINRRTDEIVELNRARRREEALGAIRQGSGTATDRLKTLIRERAEGEPDPVTAPPPPPSNISRREFLRRRAQRLGLGGETRRMGNFINLESPIAGGSAGMMAGGSDLGTAGNPTHTVVINNPEISEG